MRSKKQLIFAFSVLFLLVGGAPFLFQRNTSLETQLGLLPLLAQSEGNTSYTLIQHPLPSSSSPAWSVAADSRGRIWLAQPNASQPQLGMYDPSTRKVAEYNVSAPNSIGMYVTVDASGNVWYVSGNLNSSQNILGELKNGSQTVSTFLIPPRVLHVGGTNSTVACGAVWVAADSHGDIWIPCEFSGQIDEFFPNNSTFAQYNLPVFNSAPNQLVFDNKGDFWFTAADTEMIGEGVVSELNNGTTDGLTEITPFNQTSAYTFSYIDTLTGTNHTYAASLSYPNGIALSPDGTTLWITEHIGSSFDSYNIQTHSLVKYWTSKIERLSGLPGGYHENPYPYGIAVDSNGIVWIAEHVGNKVAEFDPATQALSEYTIPCCKGTIAGPYIVTPGKNGTVWFSELYTKNIGELVPEQTGNTDSLNLGQSLFSLQKGESMSTTVTFRSKSESPISDNVTFGASGTTDSGQLLGVSASFSAPFESFSGASNVTSQLNIHVSGLSPGIYYITVSAILGSNQVIYSRILKLVVTDAGTLLLDAAVAGVVISVAVIVSLSLFFRRKRQRLGSARARRSRRS
jgi:streptogramin lyase